MGFSKSTIVWMISLTLLMAGCANQPLPQGGTVTPPAATLTIIGQVSFESSLKTQVTSGDVTKGAAVSLIDAVSGYTYGTTEADSAGNFTLSFYDTTTSSGGGYPISPSPGVPYILEAVKGATTNSDQNHAGSDMMRVRTLLFWNNGWLSLTNSAQGNAVIVNQATTAISIVVGCRQQAGSVLSLPSLIGKVMGNYFHDYGTGLSYRSDYQPVLGLVNNALKGKQDPIANILYDQTNGQYSLATPIPVFISFTPQNPRPGEILTIYGANFDQLGNTSTFWFGNTPASTWSISADHTTITLPVPRTAVSGAFTMKHFGGVIHTISPFLLINSQ